MLKRVVNVDGTVIHVLSECQVTTKTKIIQGYFSHVLANKYQALSSVLHCRKSSLQNKRVAVDNFYFTF